MMTEGDWVLEESGHELRPEVIIVHGVHGDRVVGNTWAGIPIAERKANGRLMAAAKKLLAACKAARHVLIRNRECDKHTGSQIFGTMDADALAKIEAAIAQVEGGK